MDYTIIFTIEDLQVLNKALMDLPYKEAAPLIMKINEQIHDQNKSE